MNAPSLVSGSFEDDFFPFSLTRSLADFRCGILTIREKWNYHLKYHSSFPQGISVPANIIPDNELVLSILQMNTGFNLEKATKLLKIPDILLYNLSEIKKDFDLITKGRVTSTISTSNKVTGPDIFLEPGAVVENSFLNSSEGPIYIGRDALVMDGSMIRGPFALGNNSVVKMGAKIYGATSIGPGCVVGGEVKNSIIFGYSNKAHDGYLGDSIIGEWCNLGAGSTNSNVKNSGGSVKLWNPLKNTSVNAGLKCGLMMGDYSRSAINTSFNTGTVVGPASHVFGNGTTPSYLPGFSWGFEHEVYDFDKAVEHISRWKKMKGHELRDEEIIQLKNIYYQQNQLK